MPESKKSSLRARTDNTDQEQSGISPVIKAFLQNIVQRYCTIVKIHGSAD